MTYDSYRYIFFIAAALCGLMLAVTIVLFFALRIHDVIGDLSGRTARKAIQEIRERNEQTGNKVHKSSPINKKRGSLTDKISASGRLIKNSQETAFSVARTEKIATSKLTGEETSLLAEGTALPRQNGMESHETTLLQEVSGDNALPPQYAVPNTFFEIEFDITYIHSEEYIRYDN